MITDRYVNIVQHAMLPAAELLDMADWHSWIRPDVHGSYLQYHYTVQNTTVAKKQTNVHAPSKQAVVADAHQGIIKIYGHDVWYIQEPCRSDRKSEDLLNYIKRKNKICCCSAGSEKIKEEENGRRSSFDFFFYFFTSSAATTIFIVAFDVVRQAQLHACNRADISRSPWLPQHKSKCSCEKS